MTVEKNNSGKKNTSSKTSKPDKLLLTQLSVLTSYSNSVANSISNLFGYVLLPSTEVDNLKAHVHRLENKINESKENSITNNSAGAEVINLADSTSINGEALLQRFERICEAESAMSNLKIAKPSVANLESENSEKSDRKVLFNVKQLQVHFIYILIYHASAILSNDCKLYVLHYVRLRICLM